MSSFGSPWKDIEETEPGSVYVVGNDGWGWFFLFILVSLPFLAVAQAVVSASAWICMHPWLSAVSYLLISLLAGIVFYSRRTMQHHIWGIAATVLTMLPLAMGIGLYAIPYIALQGTLSATFDWVLIAAFTSVITYFIFSICNLLKDGRKHFVIGTIFCMVSAFFVYRLIVMEGELLTWPAILQVYGF